MERGSVNNNNSHASGLQWENLGLYGERPVDQHPRLQIDFSMSSSSSSGGGSHVFSKCPIFGASSLEPLDDFVGKLSYLHPYRNMYEDVMRVQQQQQQQNQNNNLGGTISPSGSGEPLTGLRLGRVHKEYGDHGFPHNTTSIAANRASASPSSSSIPVSSVPAKRSRASYQNMQNPCCQVEGCNLDLKLAKDYHRRHRICESHSKSPKVIVAGMERRFCQQCSRFHELSEFDDKKRSCRRRLSDHNARRRRVQPESIISNLSSANGMQSSAIYDQRPQSILLNGRPISLSNPTWENARDSSPLIRQKGAGGMDGTPPCYPTNEVVRNSISNLHISSSFHGSGSNPNPPRVLDQCLHVPNSPMAPPDLLSAQSLLSSNSWSLNEGESAASTMEGLINYNNVNNNVMRQTRTAGSCCSSDPHHNLSLFESNAINDHPPAVHESAAGAGGGGGGGGPAAAVHSINLQDPDNNSHLQEFHLFYDPGRCFYSTQRNL